MDSCLETLPTDGIDGFLFSQEARDSEDTKPVCWGRMFPLGSSCTAFGMLLEVAANTGSRIINPERKNPAHFLSF